MATSPLINERVSVMENLATKICSVRDAGRRGKWAGHLVDEARADDLNVSLVLGSGNPGAAERIGIAVRLVPELETALRHAAPRTLAEVQKAARDMQTRSNHAANGNKADNQQARMKLIADDLAQIVNGGRSVDRDDLAFAVIGRVLIDENFFADYCFYGDEKAGTLLNQAMRRSPVLDSVLRDLAPFTAEVAAQFMPPTGRSGAAEYAAAIV